MIFIAPTKAGVKCYCDYSYSNLEGTEGVKGLVIQMTYLNVLSHKPLAPYGPPGNLKTNVTSSATANVSWTLLPYLKWYSFNITYHVWAKEHLRNGSFVNHTYIFQNDATNFELSGLHPYTNVTTNIQTCNIAGCSKYSHEVFQTVESSKLMCFSFQFSSV